MPHKITSEAVEATYFIVKVEEYRRNGLQDEDRGYCIRVLLIPHVK